VTSPNDKKGVANCVLCGSAPKLYDSTDRVQFSEWVQCSYQEKSSENSAEKLRAVKTSESRVRKRSVE
jgi:Zn ribbon nucleic-acid-binding protein